MAAWAILHPARVDRAGAQLGATSHSVGAATAPVMWVLAIGVSRYRDPQFNLQFADADARALAAALQPQTGGPLYREAKTLVLTNEEVSRESILSGMERFLGQAGADDVAVIFVAGHGVQDGLSGSFYFLPYPATEQNLLTEGLRMSDFDEMVRVVRRNARSVVVMLDTCHAGALRLSSSGLLAAEDAGARMSMGEGFFLLAATRPGEDSKEKPDLAHGAFTYAVLEGLRGAADADGDGVLTVSDLFGYVAREVPRLTDGTQHPYHKMEGTDLTLAAVRHAPGAAVQLPAVERPGSPLVATPGANSIGVMEFRDLRAEAQHDWIGKAVRVALNTELSKVRALRVYSPDLIDRATDARRPDQLATAHKLGIRTLLTGSFHVVGDTIRIDAQIVDAASGVQTGSDSVQGSLDDFFGLQKKLVLSMLRRLPVEVSAEEGQSIQNRTNTNVDAYRLLLEAEGVVEEDRARTPSPRASQPPLGPRSAVEMMWRALAAALRNQASAEESGSAVVTEVRQFLDEYRRALEQKDLDRLAALYVSFSPRQRDATRAYLEGAGNLAVELADVSIEPQGQDVAVTFTRRDRFIDRETGRDTPVEVRLTKILVRDGAKWRIAR